MEYVISVVGILSYKGGLIRKYVDVCVCVSVTAKEFRFGSSSTGVRHWGLFSSESVPEEIHKVTPEFLAG